MGTNRRQRGPTTRGCRGAARWLAAALAAGLGPGCIAGHPFLSYEPLAEAPELLARREAPGAAPGPAPAPSAEGGERREPAVDRTAPGGGRKDQTLDGSLLKTVAATAPADPAPGMAPALPPPASAYPIDLPTALRLAESINPVIGEARARIGEALGQQAGARSLLLPSLNAGTNYHNHTGVLQRSSGQILSVSQQALYFGGGAGALAANPVTIPAVLISAHLSDALFEPLAARQQVAAAGLDAAATANAMLLGVATDYLQLLGTIARLRARGWTVDDAAEVARITAEYARTGEGRQADADRAATEWKLRRGAVREAEGDVAIVAARLDRRLHLDPSVRLEPAGDPLEMFTLIDPDSPLEDLVRTAVQQRPEIQARSADVARAEARLSQEWYRPILPTLWAGFSGGAFGGGSNLVPPTLGIFRGRTDFDVVAFWTLRNFGMGELAMRKRRGMEVGEAISIRARAMNLVREEVASARADVLARRQEIAIALDAIRTAREGFEKDLERIRGAAGPALEPINNLIYLARAREDLIDAVVGYNQAQFRLFVALGSPPPLQGPGEPPRPVAPDSILAPVAALPAAAGRDGNNRVRPPSPAPPGTTGSRPQPAPAATPVAAETPAWARGAILAGPVRGDLASLARARQAVIAAMGDYERAQARLMESAAPDVAVVDRAALLEALSKLAEAHRSELDAKLEYDRAVWKLFNALGASPPAAGPPDLAETRPGAATPGVATMPAAPAGTASSCIQHSTSVH